MSILDLMPQATGPSDDQEYSCPDEGFSDRFPGIYEFLARIRHKGESRKPGRVILYYEPGRAAVCFSDAESKQVAFHLDVGLEEALEAAERRLQSGKLDWRKSKRWQG